MSDYYLKRPSNSIVKLSNHALQIGKRYLGKRYLPSQPVVHLAAILNPEQGVERGTLKNIKY